MKSLVMKVLVPFLCVCLIFSSFFVSSTYAQSSEPDSTSLIEPAADPSPEAEESEAADEEITDNEPEPSMEPVLDLEADPEIEVIADNLILVTSDSSKVELSGPSVLKEGTTATFQIKLHDLPEDVTAGKFILEYSPMYLEFVEVVASGDSTNIIATQNDPGALTVIAANFAGGMSIDEAVLDVKFKAKSTVGPNELKVIAELGIGSIGELLEQKTGSMELTVRAFLEGDVNDNQVLDVGDLAAMAYHFNIDSSDPNWTFISSGDYNRNNVIDLEDLVFLAKQLISNAGTFNIMEASVASIHAAIKKGELTFVELIQMYLDRIEAYDKKGPTINSIITINPDALKLAEEMDADFAATGQLKSLQGIPVIVKDNYDTKGMPTTAGCLCLKDHYTATDAYMVEKMKEAGAIILAKANLYEFAVGTSTVSSVGGTTVNPYDVTTNPGGSSGGTGAAIAANFGVIGLGTDTGGSIRIPSSFNSLVGIRPTIGLTSRSGIVPLALTQDVGGPMTRTVADAAAALDILAGYDNKDLMTAWNVNRIPDSYTDYLDPNGLRDARIGVIIDSNVAPGEATRPLYDQTIEDLKRLGATVVEVNLPNISEILSYGSLSGIEFKFHLNEYLATHEATAPYKNLTEIIESEQYLAGLKNTLIQRNNVESLDDEAYKDILLYRTKITQQSVLKVMADYELDALMYPATANAAGGNSGSANRIGAFAGFPSIVLPAGYTYTESNNPRPFGIELLTRPFEEQTLIKLGYSFEQGTKYRIAPPTTPDLVTVTSKVDVESQEAEQLPEAS